MAEELDNPSFLLERLASIYPADTARNMESVTLDNCVNLLSRVNAAVIRKLWPHLSPTLRQAIFKSLDNNMRVTVLEQIDAQLCAQALIALKESEHETLLQLLDAEKKAQVASWLEYDPDTAGSMMQQQVVAFPADMLIKDVYERLREMQLDKLRYILLLDDEEKLLSQVSIKRLVLSDINEPLSSVAKPLRAVASVVDPKSEVLSLFEQYKMEVLPVVDVSGFLKGVIMGSAVLRDLHVELASSMQTMVGVSKDEKALSTSFFSVRKRMPWLQINLITAFMAAAVVGLFESTIAQYTALAVLLPIAAGQSGNTGAQALAVTMRGLTLKEITVFQWPRVFVKELSAGFINGISIAITCALGVYVWSRNIGLTIVIAMAMVVSMTLASVSGAMVPVVLKKLGLDPAQSSSIVLTTVTDIVGFFSFLGIAKAVLPHFM